MSDNTSNKNTSLPKIVDLKPGSSFQANGKTYRVSESFSIGRLAMVSLLEEELSILGTKPDALSIMAKAMEHINNYEPGEAYTLLRNKVYSESSNQKLMHYSLRACTAFINYEGEDLRYLTAEQIKEKINDWSEEGLDVRPFFVFAKAMSGQLSSDLDNATQSILEKAKTIKEAVLIEKKS